MKVSESGNGEYRRMRSSSSGSALLIVLILTTIMFLIASTLLLITMTEVHLADFEQRSMQAFYLAESSIPLGLSRLRTNINYRSDTSDTISLGSNTGLLAVEFYVGTNDGNGHYRSALAPSRYHIVLRGKGTVPGLHAAAKRAAERDFILKPFALFAQHDITLNGGCTINGNVHANRNLTLSQESMVDENFTAHGQVTIGSDTTEGIEIKINIPAFPIDRYFPKYWYNGDEYAAKPLVHDTVTLSPKDDQEPPAPEIEIYSGFPSPDNPAGIFYPASEITGTLTALQVDGTVIIHPSYPGSAVSINGVMKITPHSTSQSKFPAIISAKSLDINLIGNLEIFSNSIKPNKVEGLIYTQQDISLAGNDTPGEIITGSIFGRDIIITGNPVFQIKYDPAIISDPPPGIDLIEPGEWKEVFEAGT